MAGSNTRKWNRISKTLALGCTICMMERKNTARHRISVPYYYNMNSYFIKHKHIRSRKKKKKKSSSLLLHKVQLLLPSHIINNEFGKVHMPRTSTSRYKPVWFSQTNFCLAKRELWRSCNNSESWMCLTECMVWHWRKCRNNTVLHC